MDPRILLGANPFQFPDMLGSYEQGVTLRDMLTDRRKKKEYERTLRGLMQLNDFQTPEGQHQLLRDMGTLGYGPEAMGLQLPKHGESEYAPLPGGENLMLYEKKSGRVKDTGLKRAMEGGGHGAGIAGQVYFDQQGNPFLMSRDPQNPVVKRPTFDGGLAPRANERFSPLDTQSGIVPFGSRGSVGGPIPGAGGAPLQSPRVAEFTEEQRQKQSKATASVEQYTSSMSRMAKTAMELLNDPDVARAAGAFQGVRKTTSPQKWANIEAKVNSLKAQVGFQALADMRANSPTGGALGSVSEQENRLLQSTVAPLDLQQDAGTLRSALQEIVLFAGQSQRRVKRAHDLTWPSQGTKKLTSQDLNRLLELERKARQ